MKKITLRLLLLVFITLITSCKIPEGKFEAKHEPTGSHDATNTKLSADSDKPFGKYIADVKEMIEKIANEKVSNRIDAATPFQWIPGEKGGTCDANATTNAVLLIHGLTDTPFLMRDIGEYLNSEHCFLAWSAML